MLKLFFEWRHKQVNCPWIAHFGMAVFCDGRVSCNCGDGFAERIIGDLTNESLSQIWHGERISNLRNGMRQGMVDDLCVGCQFIQDKPLEKIQEFPDVLFFEPTVSCNLRCPQHVCMELNTNPLQYRRTIRWSLDDFVQKIVPDLKHFQEFRFFINGEAFLNKDLPAMLTEAKKANPRLYMLTSTNGNVLSEELAESLVTNGVDYVSVSVDGGYQENYERYRVRGSLGRVLENMDQLVAVKRRHNSEKPILHWRYILFRWNDSWDEMKHAVHLAKEHGFDEFTWHITTEPAGCPSPVFVPGSAEYEHIEQDVFREPYPFRSNALMHLERYH